MAKTIFEELGGRYERQGDYLIPCLTLPAEKEQPIGLFGRRYCTESASAMMRLWLWPCRRWEISAVSHIGHGMVSRAVWNGVPAL